MPHWKYILKGTVLLPREIVSDILELLTQNQLLVVIDAHYNNEWLIVAEPYAGMEREITHFRWTEDLKHWMNHHRAQIDKGDVNVFLEYRRLLKASY